MIVEIEFHILKKKEIIISTWFQILVMNTFNTINLYIINVAFEEKNAYQICFNNVVFKNIGGEEKCLYLSANNFLDNNNIFFSSCFVLFGI